MAALLPGRLVYWPSFHWHIGEGPAAPSVGLHLCLVEPPPQPGNLLAAAFAEPGSATHDIELPAEYQAAARLASASNGPAAINDKLTADWLRNRTSMGFTVPPPRYPTPALDHADIVTRDSVHPILHASRDAKTSRCAADGRVAKTHTAPAPTQMINLVNTGQPVLEADALT